MKRRINQTVSLLVLMAGLFVVNPGALAGPTPPTLGDATDDGVNWYKTATFTGDQSDGIWPNSFWSSPPVYTYNVNNLIADITTENEVDGILISLWAGSGSDGTDWIGGNAGAGKSHARAVQYSGSTNMYMGPTVDFTGGDYGIVTSGVDAHAIGAYSVGGTGGTGGWTLAGTGGRGGNGGRAGAVVIYSTGDLQTSGANSKGIVAYNSGGNGGTGGDADGRGGAGGTGGEAWGAYVYPWAGSIETGGASAPGILAYTRGGTGGTGGNGGGPYGEGGAGGVGGKGFMTNVVSGAGIATLGDSSPGIFVDFQGGDGGAGGNGGGAYGKGGNGGAGSGAGSLSGSMEGSANVYSEGSISTAGDSSPGIFARGQGGDGGNGGSAGGVYGKGGDGGTGGAAVLVTVESHGDIETTGDSSPGILALSQGGQGGDGGNAGGIYGEGGAGGGGGAGGSVSVSTGSQITTTGAKADGISARSLGGAGGDGGTGGGVAGKGGGAHGSGPGGSVAVNNHGDIATSGLDSRGIFAQSVGGFAGDVGTGAGVVGWGSSAESAGDGGTVGVTNHGMITVAGGSADTGDDKELVSAAILAQSIGGGGGDAAGSGGLVALGGSGSAGGSGNTVNVTNNGGLQTFGSDTFGIIAQSVGGGGGSGGASYGLGALGGAGNSIGDGGAASVTNTGAITTAGDGSAGILAESIGGGGGVVAGHGGDTYSPFFTKGGSGGSGGNGSTVTVHNSGNLETSGISSSGILAQSVGGGGGAGGAAYDVGLAFALALGGKSTLGGNGGQVNVDSTGGSIFTTGDYSHGIQAQSVGGGGGSGGDVRTLVLGLSFSETLAFGGLAGGGGNGGVVDLTSDSTIVTQGAQAHGLHAQSLGGGGGSGGSATTWTINLPVPELPAITGGVTLGGEGGDGGAGNVTTVNSTGDIGTSGFRSYGILAQSVGGGGGEGGNSKSGTIAINSMVMTTSIGGNGGKGGNGDAVVVDGQGNITTEGDYAYGILAQSIGGGGGAGGNSTSLVADAELVMSLEDLIPSGDVMMNMSIGGSSEGGGGGGSVDVRNTGSIVTEGAFASGILAQSIGGGGGAGGDSTEVMVEISSNPLDSLGFFGMLGFTQELSVGGSGGAGGAAGAVTIDNSGNLTTTGDFAHGILAQSIGGGGGVGGDSKQLSVTFLEMPTEFSFAFMPTTFDLVLGGSGGEGGNGGDLAVHNSGDIVTEGHFANGILAQSIGGGGGANGSITVKSFGPMSGLQSSTHLRGTNNGVGDGGTVTVENTANITTHGGFAHGILAQSIGGGGGFAGISEDDGSSTLDFSSETAVLLQNMGFGVGFAGSVGGEGNAGAVSVTHTGSITTFGDTSHGIFAQSVTGRGTAGPVSVTLASDITAHGANSDGIHAQSMGDYGNGDISINIGGTVRGGSGAGAGVNIDGGRDNTLTNAGAISALSGKAILGGGGNDTILNYGTVIGGVHLGSGANAFNNNAGARFDMGTTIDLGNGNVLTNAGILSPGGIGTILDTTLIGDLVLSASSVLEIEIGGLAPGSFDSLDVTGSVTSAGTVGAMAGVLGEMSLLSLSSPMGGVNFSFLPDFDIASEIGPGESLVLQFLTAGSGVDWTLMSYNFSGGPSNFRYDVFGQDGGVFLQATHTIPAPGAWLLGGIGLGLLGWGRRRMRW